HGDPPDLHPFPTRRSSDLCRRCRPPPSPRETASSANSEVLSFRTSVEPLEKRQHRRIPRGGLLELNKVTGARNQDQHGARKARGDRKSTRLNSSHVKISYA